MSEKITVTVSIDPAEIKAWAEKHINEIPAGVAHILFAAGDLYAGMTVEEEHRIVPADSNGGKYQTRRWTRHVTEWKPDE